MFSLQKNFIREQQKLIHQLQEQTIGNNLKMGGLLKSIELKNNLLPYFKKIAQLYAHYYPDLVEGSNLIVSLINQFEQDEYNEDYIISLDTRISQWEESLIQAKESPKVDDDPVTETKETQVSRRSAPVQETRPTPSTTINSPSTNKKIVENFEGLVLVEED